MRPLSACLRSPWAPGRPPLGRVWRWGWWAWVLMLIPFANVGQKIFCPQDMGRAAVLPHNEQRQARMTAHASMVATRTTCRLCLRAQVLSRLLLKGFQLFESIR